MDRKQMRFEELRAELTLARRHYAAGSHGLAFDMLGGVVDALLTALSAAPAPAPAAEGESNYERCIAEKYIRMRDLCDRALKQLAAVEAERDQYKQFHPTPCGVVERLWEVVEAAEKLVGHVEEVNRSDMVRVEGGYVSRLVVELSGLSGIRRPARNPSAALTPASPESQADA